MNMTIKIFFSSILIIFIYFSKVESSFIRNLPGKYSLGVNNTILNNCTRYNDIKTHFIIEDHQTSFANHLHFIVRNNKQVEVYSEKHYAILIDSIEQFIDELKIKKESLAKCIERNILDSDLKNNQKKDFLLLQTNHAMLSNFKNYCYEHKCYKIIPENSVLPPAEKLAPKRSSTPSSKCIRPQSALINLPSAIRLPGTGIRSSTPSTKLLRPQSSYQNSSSLPPTPVNKARPSTAGRSLLCH